MDSFLAVVGKELDRITASMMRLEGSKIMKIKLSFI
jgi:hypothetical protein